MESDNWYYNNNDRVSVGVEALPLPVFNFFYFFFPGCLHPLRPPPAPDGKSAGQKDCKLKKINEMAILGLPK